MGDHNEGLHRDRRPPPLLSRNTEPTFSSSASDIGSATSSRLSPNTSSQQHPASGHSHGTTPGVAPSDPEPRDRGARPSDIPPSAAIQSSRLLRQPSRLVANRQVKFQEPPMPDSPKENPSSVASITGVVALLKCPVCERTLEAPTTLHCGHTVCSTHVQLSEAEESPALESVPLSRSTTSSSSRTAASSSSNPDPAPRPDPLANLPSCPIDSCPAPSTRHRALIYTAAPSNARVSYLPPALAASGSTTSLSSTLSPNARSSATRRQKKVASPRLDITINKLIQLTLSARCEDQSLQSAPSVLTTEEQQWSSDESEEEEARPSRQLPRLYTPPSSERAHSRLETPTGVAQPGPSSHRPSSATPSSRYSSARGSAHSDSDSDAPKAKRRKTAPSSPSSSPRGPDSLAKFFKNLQAELQCEICFSLLYEPVTTPCQHTFCSKCLSRTLDHSVLCPLCRQDLPGFAYFHEHAANKVIQSLIVYAFPNVLADRKQAIEEEERNARLDTPVFVCQLSFPGLPTILHIFEPRYRLMLRRCLQNPVPAFGMIMPPRTNAPPDGEEYGTMLEIRSVQMLPDGRSMVETRGTYRFRIVEKGVLDGYAVARIVRIDDLPDDADDLLERTLTTPPQGTVREPTVEQLMQTCREFYDQLRDGAAPWVVKQLNDTYGPMPEDPSTFGFWMAMLLPIDDHQKAALLSMRSPRLRLRLIVHWIESLNNTWWFGQGCVIS